MLAFPLRSLIAEEPHSDEFDQSTHPIGQLWEIPLFLFIEGNYWPMTLVIPLDCISPQ